MVSIRAGALLSSINYGSLFLEYLNYGFSNFKKNGSCNLSGIICVLV